MQTVAPGEPGQKGGAGEGGPVAGDIYQAVAFIAFAVTCHFSMNSRRKNILVVSLFGYRY